MNCGSAASSLVSPRRGVGLALSLALAALVAACGQGEAQQKTGGAAPPPPAVTVAKPVQRMLSDYDEYVGRFAAVNSVEVRARVSGYLNSVDFKDGQMVKQGDLLFTIDKRPFQTALDQARANLTLAQSNLTYTESDLKRAQQLVTEKTITEQVFEQRSQAFRNAQASVAAAERRRPPGRARHAVHRIARADRRPHRRPPRLARQSRHRRHLRQHDAARDHRLDRPDPLRVHLRRGLVSALRAHGQGGHRCRQPRPRSRRRRIAQADRREGLHPRRPHGLRRQRHRSLDRHDPRPRRVRQRQRRVHAGHVRARARAGLAALQGAAGAGCRHRHRAGAAIMCSWSAPTTRWR